MSKIHQLFYVPEFDSTSRNNSELFTKNTNQFYPTMAARPNSNSGSTNDKSSGGFMQRMSGSSCNDSSSKSSSSVKNVADNVLNSWFFRNPNSNSQSNQNNSGGKFKADMNLWMPQSMWHIKWKKSKQKRTKKKDCNSLNFFTLQTQTIYLFLYTFLPDISYMRPKSLFQFFHLDTWWLLCTVINCVIILYFIFVS